MKTGWEPGSGLAPWRAKGLARVDLLDPHEGVAALLRSVQTSGEIPVGMLPAVVLNQGYRMKGASPKRVLARIAELLTHACDQGVLTVTERDGLTLVRATGSVESWITR